VARRRTHPSLHREVETYLDGEAEPTLAILVEQHLAECWACSADAEWPPLIKATLVTIDPHHPPELATARLRRFASMLSAAVTDLVRPPRDGPTDEPTSAHSGRRPPPPEWCSLRDALVLIAVTSVGELALFRVRRNTNP